MDLESYIKSDAIEIAKNLKDNKTTPKQLLVYAQQLSREWTKKYNFISSFTDDQDIDIENNNGPFFGIPILIKNSDTAYKALPSSQGSNLFANKSYDRDATVVQRLKQAGFIPFGRTTVPELCMGPTTEASHNEGPTRNPWNESKSAGGSSGGAAVAVALGVVPIAHASDGGGSIRVPASSVGIYGMKPSRGLIPAGPYKGEGWAGLSTEGVLAATVRDTAAALDVVSGYEDGAPYAAPACVRSFSDCIQPEHSRKIKVLVWTAPWETDIPVHGSAIMAVDAIAEILSDNGHSVVRQITPHIGFEKYTEAQAKVVAASTAAAVSRRLSFLGRGLEENDLENATREAYEIGKTITAIEYASAVSLFHDLGRRMAMYMQDADIILTPALTKPPISIGELTMSRGFWDFRKELSQYVPFFSVFNATGQPAATIPTGIMHSGIPISAQIVGKFGRDDIVLKVSAEIEREQPWQAALDELRRAVYSQRS